MERLTFEGNFCDIAQCRELPCKYDGNCTQRQVWERLKQFEDTIGTPGKAAWAKKTIDMAFSDDTSEVERLRELAEADKAGRCVVLPCKVGDTVYMICRTLNADYIARDEILARRVKGYGGNALNKVWLTVNNGSYNLSVFPSEFGKTVFLTREEAERAMEGKKDG